MWISECSTPDFRTINYFRGKRLQGEIHRLFAEVVRLLQELNYVSLDIQYIDGTKIEAAANKYTFVWRGSVEKNKVKLEEKLKSVIQDIEAQTHEDDMKLIKAIPINPVSINVIPKPRSGAGTLEYFKRSRMAAMLTMARNQPTPEPIPNTEASATEE